MYSSPRPYPFIPAGRMPIYVPADHILMTAADKLRAQFLDLYPEATVTASIIVKNDEIIGQGTNRPIHQSFCPRTVFKMKSGEGYDLCPHFCHPDNHSEAQAIANAMSLGHDTEDSDLYLNGHWWLCKPCWDKIEKAGIKNVYLPEGATEKFYSDVSIKGEPTKSLRVRVCGKLPDPRLSQLFERVNIILTDSEADYDFYPDLDTNTAESFVLRLHEALMANDVYNQ